MLDGLAGEKPHAFQIRLAISRTTRPWRLGHEGNSMPSNIEITEKGYDFFKRGDVPGLIKEIVDDNCTWIGAGPKDKLPWAGHFKGKQGVANFFTQVAQHLEFTDFTAREMIEQGDTVVVIGTSSARAKNTGKTVDNEWVHVLKYKQGKLIFWQEYTDTAAEVLVRS
jgi:uncharacterized protein